MRKSEKVLYAVCILFIVWLVLSFINIVMHNMSDYNYASWNMIELLFGAKRG